MPVGRDRYELAQVLDLRIRNAAWWVEQMAKHPSGIVPAGTLARMMGVSKSRVSQLCDEGRFTILEGLPSGNPRLDRFIPFREFLKAPNALYRGLKFDKRGWDREEITRLSPPERGE